MESALRHTPLMASLTAHQLKCVRNEFTLFEGLDLQVQGGEVLQIEGPNGSGKTSLLRILCGLSLAEEGKVAWCGKDILADRPRYFQDLVFIGHHNGIKEDLSCEENLRWYQATQAQAQDVDLDEILARVGLAEREEVPARKLSAGQRRRLALARLYMTRARCWILDEPFTALDVQGRALLEQRFDAHCEEGGLILFTTHHEVRLRQAQVKPLRMQT